MICWVELENDVIKKGLCTSCGACQGLCPYWLSYRGETIHMFTCEREEGRCYAFCPRMKTDLAKLRGRIFFRCGLHSGDRSFLWTLHDACGRSGHQTRSQHGGTTTALVELAMREGIIDAAVLTDMASSMNPKGVLVKKPEDVRKYGGSSFQVPPILSTLNKALRENEFKKIGVVGTPCKTLAVYKIKSRPFPKNDNNAGNIGMVFGLFCGYGLNWEGLEKLVERHSAGKRVKHMDILPSKFHQMVLKTAKKKVEVPLDEVYPIVKGGCNYCSDMTAEFSDISIGGARSSKGWDVDQHWNQVILRTQQGVKLLELARKKGILEFKAVEETNLDKIKKASLNKKKTALKNLSRISGNTGDLAILTPTSRASKRPVLIWPRGIKIWFVKTPNFNTPPVGGVILKLCGDLFIEGDEENQGQRPACSHQEGN